jgi:hypothetical protein
MKKPEVYLKEYCSKLSDDNVKFLVGRLNQRLGGDLAEAVDFLSGVREIDRWLGSAVDSNEFYDMVDLINNALNKEHDRRMNLVPA